MILLKKIFQFSKRLIPLLGVFFIFETFGEFARIFAASPPASFSAPAQMSPREAEILKKVSEEESLGKKIEILKAASEKEWASLAVFFNLANLNHARGDLSEAVKNYEVALEKSPNFFAARKNLGLTLAALGKTKEAEIELKKALALSGGCDAEILLWLVDKYADNGDNFSALSCCNQALIYEPKNAAALRVKAQLLYQCGLYYDCENLASEILKKDFSLPQIWKIKALAQIKLGDARGAISSLEVLRLLKNSDTQSDISLAGLYYNEGLYDKSAEIYELALKGGAASEQLLISTAKAFISADRPEASLKILNQSNEENFEISKLKGEAYLALNRVEAAELLFEKCLRQNPLNPEVSLYMGKIRMAESRFSEAEDFFTAASSDENFLMESLYAILKCQTSLGDVDRALKTISKIRKIKDSSVIEEYEKSLKEFQSAKDI